MMLAKYYLETDLICIMVLVCLAYQTVHSNFRKTNQVRFLEVLVVNIIFAFSDVIWIFNNGYISYSCLPFNGIIFGYIMNGINVCCSALAGWSWLRFSENFLDRHYISTPRGVAVSLIPIIILAVLTITTGKTHLLFYITEEGQYVRQSGYVLQLILSYSYILTSVIIVLVLARKTANRQAKERNLGIASFAIFPIIACVVQLFNPNMSVIFIGTLLSLLNVYITLQGQQVLNDPLTGLNNRMLLDQKVMSGMEAADERHDFWLLIMDVNKFKGINDTYGHLEGDHTLVRIADTLKKASSDRGDFICRYGGDEFVLLHMTRKNEDCSKLISKINQNLAEYELPYNLSVSIGAAKYTSEIDTWAQLMEKADAELYKAKKG